MHPMHVYTCASSRVWHVHTQVHELCLAQYELSPLGCRELLRLATDYPFLASPLRAFLTKFPRLLWLHLAEEAAACAQVRSPADLPRSPAFSFLL